MHFQEYWVRLHAEPEALAVIGVGLDARPSRRRACSSGSAAADLILLAPSNPVVSIGPILGVPGVRQAVLDSPARVVGFAGILGGAPVLGMAHRLLPVIGVDVDAGAVGRHYGGRSTGGILDLWVMDSADAASAAALETGGPAHRGHRSDHARPVGDRRVHPARGQGARFVISIFAPDGIGEVGPGDDLAALVHTAVAADPHGPLRDGDIVVVTSKIVSKAEDRRVPAARRDAGHPRRDGTDGRAPWADHDHPNPERIDARRRRGRQLQRLPGEVLLLPVDPDASAERLRATARSAWSAGGSA